MNDDQIDDLKQYISATISQATADIATKSDIADMATKSDIANMATRSDIAALRAHLNEIQESIAESISIANDNVEE